MTLTTSRRRAALITTATLLGVVAVAIEFGNSAAVQASDSYQGRRAQLQADLKEAGRQGYGEDDLAPVVERLRGLEAAPEPVWIGSRADFYRQQTQAISGLRGVLREREALVLEDARGEGARALAAARAQLDRNRQLGTDEAELAPLKTRLEEIARVQGQAREVKEVRGAAVEARRVDGDAAAVAAAQEAENAAVRAAAEDLKARLGGNPAAVRQAALEALATARNEASWAGFLNQAGSFTGYEALGRAYRLLEKFAEESRSADPERGGLAAGAVVRYSDQVHQAMAKGMPAKAILVSVQAQRLWAYEGGRAVRETIVTTGRPELPTDIGPMKVLWRASNWKMTSPWPKESPFYYPPSDVRKVVWFTETGEGMHDAPWRSWFGPGSNVGDGTHGCVNLPGNAVDFIYDWAPNGTPVIVIPGNGAPQSAQLAANTIDTPAGQQIKGA